MKKLLIVLATAALSTTSLSMMNNILNTNFNNTLNVFKKENDKANKKFIKTAELEIRTDMRRIVVLEYFSMI